MGTSAPQVVQASEPPSPPAAGQAEDPQQQCAGADGQPIHILAYYLWQQTGQRCLQSR